jgi:sarcosine oxidase delta subunit
MTNIKVKTYVYTRRNKQGEILDTLYVTDMCGNYWKSKTYPCWTKTHEFDDLDLKWKRIKQLPSVARYLDHRNLSGENFK